MRLLVAAGAQTRIGPLVIGAAVTGTVVLGALSACSTGGSSTPTPSATSKKPSPTAASTFDPMAGPAEAAAQLPKSCSKILSDTDLTSAFGSPQVGDTSYGNYAPLPTIGRTGRVTCGFDIGVDQTGKPGPPGLTVSIITYNTAANAVSRVANSVNDSVAKGATARSGLINGHPATILFEPAAASAPPVASVPPPSGTAGAAQSAPPAASSPAAPPSPSPSAAVSGVYELLMADGNRTFVIDIPTSKATGDAAATTLEKIMVLVYQHTLPPTAPPSPTAPAAPSASASASGTASPKPSAK
jgi:hypothetical protein